MTPIAIKSFGIDTESGLEKQLQVWSVFCDAENEQITIIYKIILLSPTGTVFSVINRGGYLRNGTKFQTLGLSEIGVGITALIEGDLENITSYDTIANDLRQITE